jgi:hypothetical protein
MAKAKFNPLGFFYFWDDIIIKKLSISNGWTWQYKKFYAKKFSVVKTFNFARIKKLVRG